MIALNMFEFILTMAHSTLNNVIVQASSCSISLHLLLVTAEYCKAEGKQLSRAEIVSVFTAYFKLDRALEALANLLPLREKGGKSLNRKLHNIELCK